MAHEIAPERPRRVTRVQARAQHERRGADGTARQHVDPRRERQLPPAVPIDDLDARDASVALDEAGRQHARDDREVVGVRVRERRLRHVVLGADTAGKAVAGDAVDAEGLARAAVVDRDRDLERMQAERASGVGDAPGGRGERRGWARVVAGARRLRRVVACAAVHLQQRLGRGVVGFNAA